MGKQLGEVNFDHYMVVGGFALEPDQPPHDASTGKPQDRGYGVKIKSVRKKGSDAVTVRLKIVGATDPRKATGPLHYALAVVPRHLGGAVFYVNGKEYSYAPDGAFINQNPKPFFDQLKKPTPDG
jgi:hypothetical protein